MIATQRISENKAIITIDNMDYVYDPTLLGDWRKMVNLIMGLVALVNSKGNMMKTVTLPFYKGREQMIVIARDNDGNLSFNWHEKAIGWNNFHWFKSYSIAPMGVEIEMFKKEVEELRKVLIPKEEE